MPPRKLLFCFCIVFLSAAKYTVSPGCCRFGNVPFAYTTPGLGGNGLYCPSSALTLSACQSQCTANIYCISVDFVFAAGTCCLWFGNPTSYTTGCDKTVVSCYIKGMNIFSFQKIFMLS